MSDPPSNPSSADDGRRGAESGSDELVAELYDRLRGLARARMRHLADGNTLQPTDLVHEAYLKLAGASASRWDGERHFYSAAARAMQQILVDQARRKATAKHGGGQPKLSPHTNELAINAPSEDVLALDEAVSVLEKTDPRKAEIARLRCFLGATEGEAAQALGVSEVTVRREWRFVKAFLRRFLDVTDGG